MRRWDCMFAAGLALASVSLSPLWAQRGATLTDAEEDKVREAQDPGERIVVYLDLLQTRLDRFESSRREPDNPKYDYAGYLDDLLVEYIALNDELKNWIQFQYQEKRDMRRGLRALLERGPQQLAALRQAQQSPDAFVSQYGDTLRDAIAQLSDTLDGATRALDDQEKKFAEMKRGEKAAARISKERAKEEAKRTKEEKKLRKRLGKGKVPGESDEN
jgi:septal ring factor EnvC (AmiA/AmiB activator)